MRPGARARVQIRPPYAGEAQIVVATDRVIETRTVRVGPDGTTIDLPVTAEWGSGAYVLVTVMTPRDPVNLPVPRRAVGVAYVPVDMGSRTLQVAAGEGLRNVRPRTHIEVPVAGARRAGAASACASPSPWSTKASSTSPSMKARIRSITSSAGARSASICATITAACSIRTSARRRRRARAATVSAAKASPSCRRARWRCSPTSSKCAAAAR